MSIFNQIPLTQEEEDCILHFLREAENNGQPSANEPYYSTINSIFTKYWKRHNQINALKYYDHWDDC